ncbi:RNA polymerase sigma factor [Flagellimonas pacifica]|uniref:RNA polymerase sigma-70 factor, ECF subfamily n=1 Tax=Flagellimonas pacifica TaxID=1247520 RepID=A0A285MTA4_9FLAO|nr:RNA polymerase sigma-70 factor [Allomuricauda parva]SNZ00420.1 RNA polymerase sigma-70 factor, ECF subfamily [Allomuricauda parva]
MKSIRTKKKKISVLFEKHYKRLFNYAFKVVEDSHVSKELVQETFIKLWENFENVKDDERAIESYLITVLKNKIIDNHRKRKTQEKHFNLYKLNTSFTEDIDSKWELEKEIEKIYNSLPPKTADIFKLSRDKGLTYQEIAALKNISVKTVELHISRALHTFRKELKDYL